MKYGEFQFKIKDMRKIKTYNQFKESLVIDLNFQGIEDLLESLTVWYDALLSAIGAEELNIFDTLKLPQDDFLNKLDLDILGDNVEFINSLSSISLKKSPLENSDNYQTFLNKPCRFMFLYDINSNELENPIYIMMQVFNETLNKWEDLKLYKINDDVKKFYDKLTSRTIEIVDGDQNYIYTSDNANEWTLQNKDNLNDIYKEVFRKEEMQDLLKDKNVKVNII
jgi:hypothetical protein